MAKVQIEDDYVDIRLSLLERLTLADRSRRVPLLHIRGVDTYPAERPDGALAQTWSETHHWSEGLIDGDDSPLRGEPSKSRCLTIDLCDEDVQRVVLEVEDDSPEIVADRIRLAVAAAQASAIEQMRARSTRREIPPMPPSEPPPGLEMSRSPSMPSHEGIPYRITPLPRVYSEPAPPMLLDDDRSLARLGAWLLGFGMFSLLTGSAIVAGGVVPGLIAIGAGAACACMGGLALAVVLHHQ